MTYTPPIFFNDFWLLREHYTPVNETLEEVQLALDLAQMPMWKFTIYTQVEKSFDMQVRIACQQRCVLLSAAALDQATGVRAGWPFLLPVLACSSRWARQWCGSRNGGDK
jgi:hypothetical protein